MNVAEATPRVLTDKLFIFYYESVHRDSFPIRMNISHMHSKRTFGCVVLLTFWPFSVTPVRGSLGPMEIPKVIFGVGITTFDDLRANQAEVPTSSCWPSIFSNYCLKA